MKLAEIAKKIGDHVRRLAADPEANAFDYERDGKKSRVALIWSPACWAGGRYVYIKYVAYQTQSRLTKDEALRYLAYLDGGGKRRHYQALRAAPCS